MTDNPVDPWKGRRLVEDQKNPKKLIVMYGEGGDDSKGESPFRKWVESIPNEGVDPDELKALQNDTKPTVLAGASKKPYNQPHGRNSSSVVK